MSYLRILSTIGVLLLLNTNANARAVEQHFERCASAALQTTSGTQKVVSVDTLGLQTYELDHSNTRNTVEFRMHLKSKASGEEVGVVKCTLNRSGDLLAAVFD